MRNNLSRNGTNKETGQMYENHVPIINAAMRACPDTFARGVMFAILSARTQFVTVPDQLNELKKRGRDASCLWNWKTGAYDYVMAHKRELWRDTCAATCPEQALKILCRVPGLGIVKAAFVLQFLGHDIACLDVRNIQREGLNPRTYRTDGIKSGAAFDRKVARYVAQTGGRARELWNTWCSDVAGTYRLTAQEVSEMHLKIVPPGLQKSLAPIPSPMYGANQVPF